MVHVTADGVEVLVKTSVVLLVVNPRHLMEGKRIRLSITDQPFFNLQPALFFFTNIKENSQISQNGFRFQEEKHLFNTDEEANTI